MKKYSRISSETIHSNPYWNYKFDEYVLPSGSNGKYYYVDSRGSTLIIPKLYDGKFVLTKQYRYLNKLESIEFPGGGLSQNCTSEKNALNELEEETGFKAENISLLGEYNPFNGVTNEICKVFLAEKLIKTEQKLDESEQIELLFLTFDEINNLIISNKIWDGMSISAWMFYLLKIKN